MDPLVSVIIPVGPAHAAHVATALASLRWQTAQTWEAIVINDTGADLAAPGATVLPGHRNVAANRNAGIAVARAPYVLFLDADDYLLPTALAQLLRRLNRSQCASYVYGDAYMLLHDGRFRYARAPDYQQAKLAHFNLHVVTALYATADVRNVGGFDVGIDAWEDWTLPLKLAIAGGCGERLEQPTLVYRVAEGTRREMSVAGGRPVMDTVLARYANSQTREITFMPCNCGGGGAQQALASYTATLSGDPPAPAASDGRVRLVYTDGNIGAIPFRSPYTGIIYRGGMNQLNRYADADPRDVAWLVDLGVWELLPAPPVPVRPPDPTQAQPAVLTAPEETPIADLAVRPATNPTPVSGPDVVVTAASLEVDMPPRRSRRG